MSIKNKDSTKESFKNGSLRPFVFNSENFNSSYKKKEVKPNYGRMVIIIHFVELTKCRTCRIDILSNKMSTCTKKN